MNVFPRLCRLPFFLVLSLVALPALRGQNPAPPAATTAAPDAAAKAEITKVLNDQVNAWNLGSIDKFMDGYWRSDTLRFASGGNVTTGWQATLARYKERYPDRAAMGTLAFNDLAIEVLSPDAATAFGRWRTTFADGTDAHGLFTLVLRKTAAGWKIVSDHTSAAK